MDMSSGHWFSHMGMGHEATTTYESQMIMSSPSEEDGLSSNHFDPSADLYFNGMMRSSSLTQNNINVNDNTDGYYFQPFSSSALGINVIPKEVKPELEMHMLHNTSNASGWSSCPSSSSGQFISFASSHQLPFDANYNASSINVQPNDDYGGIKLPSNYYEDDDRGSYMDLSHQKQRNRRVGGVSLCSQEHVLAERKRREIMTQRFLALSALIPGLNKTDKASILGDAAKYLKELEEQVKLLEEQTTQRTIECAVLMTTRQQHLNLDDISSSSYDKNDSTNPLLEIEARASNNNVVLIRIHSQKDQGLVQKVLNEIEKLHLTTLNCSTMPFGGYAMNITIIAQMNDDLCMTVKDLVMHLRLVLEQFLCFSK